MNVFHVNKDFSGTGAQRVSLTILAGINAERSFYCAERGEPYNTSFVAALRSAGVIPVFFRGLSNRRVLWLPFAILQLVRLIRGEHIDLVHSHSFLAGIAARIAAFLTGTPCVHTFHGAPSPKYRPLAFAVSFTVERVLALVTCFVVFNTEHQRRLMMPAMARARVIHNYVPSAPRKKTRDPGALPNVLFLGRFEFQKNPVFFVQLAAAIGVERARFRMVGGGTLSSIVDAANREYGTGIEVLNFAEDPSPHFAWADCFVLCSRYESFPLVIGEAISAGCSVVCSRIDGLDEIWGGAVRFYEEGSLKDAVRALEEAFDAHGTPCGIGVAERFGVEPFQHAYRALYVEALAGRLVKGEAGPK